MFNFFQPNIPQVDATEVKKTIDTKENVILLDVRTPDEYAEGHLPGSVLMPLQTLQQNVTQFTDKSKKMYVYCRSGSRSAHAVVLLQQLGFTNVENMKGGMLAWSAKVYPVSK